MKGTSGWAVIYSGITCLSIGVTINEGTDWGFITAGVCLIIVGLMQKSEQQPDQSRVVKDE